MPEHGRRATDLQTPERRGSGAAEVVGACPESGMLAFPLFSEPPFVNWYHYRKQRIQHRQHPSSSPPILLWDEAEDP
jgi:hypothetical protein